MKIKAVEKNSNKRKPFRQNLCQTKILMPTNIRVSKQITSKNSKVFETHKNTVFPLK